ncbi:hypothetical protein IWZ01DRAFT_36506 [Phyllosticta capitalensis]
MEKRAHATFGRGSQPPCPNSNHDRLDLFLALVQQCDAALRDTTNPIRTRCPQLSRTSHPTCASSLWVTISPTFRNSQVHNADTCHAISPTPIPCFFRSSPILQHHPSPSFRAKSPPNQHHHYKIQGIRFPCAKYAATRSHHQRLFLASPSITSGPSRNDHAMRCVHTTPLPRCMTTPWTRPASFFSKRSRSTLEHSLLGLAAAVEWAAHTLRRSALLSLWCCFAMR